MAIVDSPGLTHTTKNLFSQMPINDINHLKKISLKLVSFLPD